MNELIRADIAALNLPNTSITFGEIGARIRSEVADGHVAVDIQAGIPIVAMQHEIRLAVSRIVAIHGGSLAGFQLSQRIASHVVQPNVPPSPSIRNVIAIASGKGGVGKSTTAVNLAVALQLDGAKVGILDADIYGPSVPAMLGLSGRPDSPDGKSIEPMRAHGLEAMSIGFLIDIDTPMIWRGPMATSALTQLFNETLWGGTSSEGLDYLIVDLPPGTGDIQLTLSQKIPVAGAVIVTTPQDIATLDAKKALKMFEKVQVPVLGVIENMAVHVCGSCGHSEHIFGSGGGEKMAAQYGVPLLGSLPLELGIREQGDAGAPIVIAHPDSAAAHAYRLTARNVAAQLALRPRAMMGIAASLV